MMMIMKTGYNWKFMAIFQLKKTSFTALPSDPKWPFWNSSYSSCVCVCLSNMNYSYRFCHDDENQKIYYIFFDSSFKKKDFYFTLSTTMFIIDGDAAAIFVCVDGDVDCLFSSCEWIFALIILFFVFL